MLAFDSETALMQAGLMAPPLACITWTEDVNVEAEICHHSDPAAKFVYEHILCNPHVGANTAYDLAVAGAQFPELLPLIFESLDADLSHDVITIQKLFDIGNGAYRGQEVDEGGDEPVYKSYKYSLSDIHQRHFGQHLEKDKWRLQYGKLRHKPLSEWPEGAIFYAKYDATSTLKVYNAQMTCKLRAPTQKYLVPETFHNRSAFALQLIACWGFLTDTREVDRFLKALAVDQAVRREALIKTKLVRPDGVRNMNLSKEMMRATLGDNCVLTDTGVKKYREWWAEQSKAKIKITEETKTKKKRELFEQGYVSLSSATCLMSGNKTLLEFARYGQHQLLTSKVQRLKTGGYPIQTSFENLLETGRTSSSASKLIPNSAAIQNLPRKIGMRECFVPRNSDMRLPIEQRRVLIPCDFGMAELVSLAENCFKLFGYSKLRDALNAGLDPHLDLASQFLGISYEDAKKRKNEETLIEYRTMSKAFNFGKPGGLGNEKFMLWAGVTYGVKFGDTPEEALDRVKALTKVYFETYPEIKQYLKWVGDRCDNPTGLCDLQHLYSGLLRGRIQYTVAANSSFQSLTAHGFKSAMWAIIKRCYIGKKTGGYLKTATFEPTYLYGCRVLAPVHDELVPEVPELIADECSKEVEEVMCEEYQKWTPNVKITVERSMSRRWRKGAKPVFRNGKLIPYEDACMEALFGFIARCKKTPETKAA